MSRKVNIKTSQGAYDVRIGPDLLKQSGQWVKVPAKTQKQAFLVYDESLSREMRQLYRGLRRGGWRVKTYGLPANEKAKDIRVIQRLYGQMLEDKANRDTVLFALGGGAVGDAAGFVAATYMRGIPWVVVPTTLLSQVDSAIGGKTAINSPAGKNLIGAFHQPRLVLCDTQFLRTLPHREVISGFGEIIKYGLIFDRNFFLECRKNMDQILDLKEPHISKAIWKSARWKASVVEKDELDRKGLREALNFGHTVGHALEATMGYGRLRHGEAVIWGMRVAAALSMLRGHMKKQEFELIDNTLAKAPVPAIKRTFEMDRLVRYMKKDKKSRNQQVRFILLKSIGKTLSDHHVQTKDLKKAFRMVGLKVK